MIIGYIDIEQGAVVTHRDSFMLSTVSVVSVRRPYLAGALMLVAGVAGFVATFHDLLYEDEMLIAGGASIALLIVGFKVAQLSLLSRDLKGTELSSAVWGTNGDLQEARTDIVAMRQAEQAHLVTEHPHGSA